MRILDKNYHSIFLADDEKSICIFDQKLFPWQVKIIKLETYEQAAMAISDMTVRGAPLLAMVGAYGLALAMAQNSSDEMLNHAYNVLVKTRPTAINLKWALDKVYASIKDLNPNERKETAYKSASELCKEDIEINRQIGLNGLEIIKKISAEKSGKTVNILTHCNAGWLATVDYGTATSPIYQAYDMGIDIHVWVDETRPRNQGGFLTAFELQNHGVPHHVIVDNTGGHLMQKNMVDFCIVGADRVTKNGDVCNKIGTYLKALAAKAHNIPFYVALPTPTIDLTLSSGDLIPIEERDDREVTHIWGRDAKGEMQEVQLTLSQGFNPGFDVTPAQYISGYITEKGIFENINHISL